MKYKIAAFFAGRNGVDELSKATLWTSVILALVSCVVPVKWLSSLLYCVSLVGLFYSYYRMLSKKLAQRQSENRAFLNRKRILRQQWDQRKTHRFYRCPKCRTTLRVPKGKGKISITCRSCGEKLIRKT